LIKEIIFLSPLRRYFFPCYLYNFTPSQLLYLCQCIEDTKDVSGNIAEVGCASGATTVFLNKYLDAREIKKEYYAIDTFSGFVKKDVDYEVMNRGKESNLFRHFQANKKKWFDGTMKQNNINRVRSIQNDVNEFDLTTLGPLSFCLLDVDLYRPVKKCLKELYGVLSPGGILIVDDCNPGKIKWDGSDQAYKEFMKETDLPIQIMHGKLGVIQKKP
jgi:SAM-dependent methyltransferase